MIEYKTFQIFQINHVVSVIWDIKLWLFRKRKLSKFTMRINQKNSNTFGKDFNDNGGGTYAIEISKDNGITVWFWPRNDPKLPNDIKNENILTTNWETHKDNKIQFNACLNHFKNLVPIINTTLCGDWAVSVYNPNNKN